MQHSTKYRIALSILALTAAIMGPLNTFAENHAKAPHTSKPEASWSGILTKVDDSNVALKVKDKTYDIASNKEKDLLKHINEQVKISGSLKTVKGKPVINMQSYKVVKG